MNNIIDFDFFMASKNIKHEDLILNANIPSTYMFPLLVQYKGKYDGLSYFTEKKIDIDLIQQDNTGYFYSHYLTRAVDIISDIYLHSTKKANIEYTFNGVIYKDLDYFLSVCSVYSISNMICRFKERPTINDIIYIRQRNYLLQPELRSEMFRKNIQTYTHLYKDGCVGSI
jgi:hypothetical protein